MQTHDFNSGIDNGLFWTKRIPDSSVEIHLDKNRAMMRVQTIELEDYHDVVNALQDGPSKEAVASFTVHWSGHNTTQHIHDAKQQFRGTYSLGKVTVEWKAEEAGLTYETDPASTSETVFALLGRERNGVFF